jgi:transcriptional regulator with XRE-family HTH domain
MKFAPNKLAQLRKEAGLSIEKLMIEFDKVGLSVHTNTIRYWENGRSKPDVNDLAIISSFYNKPVSFFFDK